jgi:hypothetical protein
VLNSPSEFFPEGVNASATHHSTFHLHVPEFRDTSSAPRRPLDAPYQQSQALEPPPPLRDASKASPRRQTRTAQLRAIRLPQRHITGEPEHHNSRWPLRRMQPLSHSSAIAMLRSDTIVQNYKTNVHPSIGRRRIPAQQPERVHSTRIERPLPISTSHDLRRDEGSGW